MSANRGNDFIESLDSIFQEARDKGFRDRSEFSTTLSNIVGFLRSCTETTRAKARARCHVVLPDGTVPQTNMQLPPKNLVIDDDLLQRLLQARTGKVFTDILRETLGSNSGSKQPAVAVKNPKKRRHRRSGNESESDYEDTMKRSKRPSSKRNHIADEITAMNHTSIEGQSSAEDKIIATQNTSMDSTKKTRILIIKKKTLATPAPWSSDIEQGNSSYAPLVSTVNPPLSPLSNHISAEPSHEVTLMNTLDVATVAEDVAAGSNRREEEAIEVPTQDATYVNQGAETAAPHREDCISENEFARNLVATGEENLNAEAHDEVANEEVTNEETIIEAGTSGEVVNEEALVETATNEESMTEEVSNDEGLVEAEMDKESVFDTAPNEDTTSHDLMEETPSQQDVYPAVAAEADSLVVSEDNDLCGSWIHLPSLITEASVVEPDAWDSYKPKLLKSLRRLSHEQDHPRAVLDPTVEGSPPHGLATALFYLKDDVAKISPTDWASYEAKLQILCTSPEILLLDWRQRLFEIVNICYLPEELNSMASGEWDKLVRMVKICSVIAIMTGPSNEPSCLEQQARWVQAKTTDIMSLKKLFGAKAKIFAI